MARNWLGTLNNPEDLSMVEAYLETWSKAPKCTYVTGQLEKGKEGTVHVQYFLNFSDKVRLAHLKKVCARSHYEEVKINNGADEYCNKEDTRIEGPWSFGIKPARRNKKGDVKRRNEEILEMGAEKAVQEGFIAISQYKTVKQSIDLFKISTTKPVEADRVRGTWIWGPPGVGKSRYARDNFTDIFCKPQSKWFDGYTGQ